MCVAGKKAKTTVSFSQDADPNAALVEKANLLAKKNIALQQKVDELTNHSKQLAYKHAVT